jgi:hypothetical protein
MSVANTLDSNNLINPAYIDTASAGFPDDVVIKKTLTIENVTNELLALTVFGNVQAENADFGEVSFSNAEGTAILVTDGDTVLKDTIVDSLELSGQDLGAVGLGPTITIPSGTGEVSTQNFITTLNAAAAVEAPLAANDLIISMGVQLNPVLTCKSDASTILVGNATEANPAIKKLGTLGVSDTYDGVYNPPPPVFKYLDPATGLLQATPITLFSGPLNAGVSPVTGYPISWTAQANTGGLYAVTWTVYIDETVATNIVPNEIIEFFAFSNTNPEPPAPSVTTDYNQLSWSVYTNGLTKPAGIASPTEISVTNIQLLEMNAGDTYNFTGQVVQVTAGGTGTSAIPLVECQLIRLSPNY